MGNTGKAAVVVYGYLGRAVQELFGVEDVVDFLVLHETVGVDTGFGDVEVPADEGGSGGDVVADFLCEIFGDFGDDGGVHAVCGSSEGGVFHDHGFQRAVAGAFADAQQGAVDAGAAVQPGGGGIGDHLIEVVVAVPFQHGGGDAGVVHETVHDAGDGAGEGCPCIGDAVAHGIAGTDLHGDAALFAELVQLFRKGKHKAVEVGTGDVLEVAAGGDPHFQHVGDDGQVFVQCALPGETHFVVDMVVGAGHKHTRFPDAQGFYQLKVLFGGTDPCGDFRELVAQILTGGQGSSVLVGIYEEFGLPDQTLGAAQPVEHFVQVPDLLDGEGGSGLLAVPEGGIGDPDFRRHIHGHNPVVEGNLRHGFVVKQVPVQLRCGSFLQGVVVCRLFDQVGGFRKSYLDFMFTLEGHCIHEPFLTDRWMFSIL